MADLIKKIKIKKQDGTFTNYIPIGADAANVEISDGESVELKLNKKPYYYNSVADMKADIKLKVGDACQTLGYYSANDGGAGLYKIVSDNSMVDDGGNIHALENGLKAELVVGKYVSPEQFGAKGDGITDDSSALDTMLKISKNVIFILNGKYYLSRNIGNHKRENTIIIGNNSEIITNYGLNFMNTPLESNIMPIIKNNVFECSGVYIHSKYETEQIPFSRYSFGLKIAGYDTVNIQNNRIEGFWQRYSMWLPCSSRNT